MTRNRIDKGANTQPALATTYNGHDPALLERVLPLVDYIEITPDTLAMMDDDTAVLPAATLAELKNIGKEAKIIVHGIGLSIGTHSGYSQQYLRLLDSLLEQIDVAWHSEHLGYTMVDGEFLGTMLALPRTEQVLDMICERVHEIQLRYPLPFLLENIVHLLPEAEGDYSQAEFLNLLAGRTGCGLLLDVYNLECDAHNHRLDMNAFLAELNMRHVREMHLAGGVKHRGYLLDVHSRPTRESTLAFARQAAAMAENLEAMTYELLPQAVPILGHVAIADELSRLSEFFCG